MNRKEMKKYIEQQRDLLAKYLERNKQIYNHKEYMLYAIHFLKNMKEFALWNYRTYINPEDKDNQKYLLERLEYDNRMTELYNHFYGTNETYKNYDDVLLGIECDYKLAKDTYLEILKHLVVY